MSRADTRHGNPARYLLTTTEPDIRRIETLTVSSPHAARSVSAFKREYRRDVGEVIGWDDGHDATTSFVECSGGAHAGRAFHGRPMNALTVSRRWSTGGER